MGLATQRFRVQLQAEDENTCVACAAINALRHFGLNAGYEEVVSALRVKRFGERGGSFTTKAAKYLAEHHNMHVICSRAPCHIHDPMEASVEAAKRFELLLHRGYVGLLHRREKRNGHAVTLHQILWRDDQPAFVTYDSAARTHRGHRTYRAVYYCTYLDHEEMSIDEWLRLHPDKQQEYRVIPTGRTAWFVRPMSTTGAHD